MNPEILSQLKTRLQSQPRPLEELHRAARAAGSGWSAAQVHLLLDCLPDVFFEDGLFHLRAPEKTDPLTDALLTLASDKPVPAAALVSRLPRGLIATASALCEIARNHPRLELIPPNRIRCR